MNEALITLGLVLAIAGFAWLIYKVVGSLRAGSENAARADANAAGALPGSEQIDSSMAHAKK